MRPRAHLQRARGDRHAYRRLMDDPETPARRIGFHAQQAAEKAIKPVLAWASVEYPRTHNLIMLVELLRKHGLPSPPDAEELARLTPFGAALRYDDASPDEDVALDRAWAASCVDRTIRWAEASNTGARP
ncbi:MAG: HEPN domain-containing protein [Pseudomonadota bacterium]